MLQNKNAQQWRAPLTMTPIKSSQYLFYILTLKILVICLVKSDISQINYMTDMLQ